MRDKILVLTILALLFLTLPVFSVDITECGEIREDSKLTQDIYLDKYDGCFEIIIPEGETTGPVLDCQGHSINGNYGMSAIYLENIKGATVKNCDISGFAYGIQIRGGSENTFKNIVVKDGINHYGSTNRGILVWESNDNVFKNIEITSMMYGVDLWRSDGNTFKNIISNFNKDAEDWAGDYFDVGYGISLYDSDDNTFEGGEVKSNYWFGIYIGDSDDNTFTGLDIGPNGGTYVQFHGGTGRGIYLLRTDNTGNLFYHNNIYDKVNNENPEDNNWDNGERGNYWDDYEGLDDGSDGRTAGDGIGDTDIPHPGEGFDNYPLMEKYVWEPEVEPECDIDFDCDEGCICEEGVCIEGPELIDSCQKITENSILTADIDDLDRTCFVIGANDITFDCDGHEIGANGETKSARGVYLAGKSGVTIKNCNIGGFAYGIEVNRGEDITLDNIVAEENNYGIKITRGSGNQILNSEINENVKFRKRRRGYGIYIQKGNDNKIINTQTNSNEKYGIILKQSKNTLLKGVESVENQRYDLYSYKSKGTSIVDSEIDRIKKR